MIDLPGHRGGQARDAKLIDEVILGAEGRGEVLVDDPRAALSEGTDPQDHGPAGQPLCITELTGVDPAIGSRHVVSELILVADVDRVARGADQVESLSLLLRESGRVGVRGRGVPRHREVGAPHGDRLGTEADEVEAVGGMCLAGSEQQRRHGPPCEETFQGPVLLVSLPTLEPRVHGVGADVIRTRDWCLDSKETEDRSVVRNP